MATQKIRSTTQINIVRELLTAARTYYVRTNGSDSNTGLANTAGGAFLTIQKAVNTISTLDINGQTVTVQIADGTYTGGVTLLNVQGYAAPGNLVIRGNNGTPSNVHINVTGNCFGAADISVVWNILDLKMSASNICLYAQNAGIAFGNVEFGTASGAHMYAILSGQIAALSSYAVSGGAPYHMTAQMGSLIYTAGQAITFSNSPAFSTAFAWGIINGSIIAHVMTFTNGGTVTGKRYQSEGNSVVYTAGGGANYLPGNVAGTTATGGQYI